MEKSVNTLIAPKYVQDSWPTPNYIDPETKGRALEYVSIAFSAFGLVIVMLRCYARIFLTRAFGLDDALIIIALALCVALAVLLIIGIEQWYLGFHIWDLPAPAVIHHRRGMWIASYINICASSSIRISVLLFYRRLSISFSRTFLIATWIGIAYNVCFVLAFTLANSFICLPTKAYWLRYDIDWRFSHRWHCGNEGISLPTSVVATIIADLYTTILPLALVVTLRIPKRQKLALYWLFGLGFLASGACLIRGIYLCWTVLRTYDFTWQIYDMWIWNDVELFIGIFAASAPAMKPLIRNLMGMGFLGYSYTYGSNQSRSNQHGHEEDQRRRQDREANVPGSWDTWTEDRKVPEQKEVPVKYRAALNNGNDFMPNSRMSSMESIMNSIDNDQISTESFPPRLSTQSRNVIGAKAIAKVKSEKPSYAHQQEVEVDPPIYPEIAAPKPKPSNESLRATARTPPLRLYTQTSSPTPPAQSKPQRRPRTPDYTSSQPLSTSLPTQYHNDIGWIELQHVKPTAHPTPTPISTSHHHGSVKAARLRALAHENARAAQPSPSGSAKSAKSRAIIAPQTASGPVKTSPASSAKPYFDAESNHDAAIEPRPLARPVYVPSACLSDEMTRLDLSSSSEGSESVSAQSRLREFDLGLGDAAAEAEVTALPVRTGSKSSWRHG